jgi:hypothetical protein
MDIENFIAEFKKTFVYDILSQTLSDEQLFEHVVDGDAVLWFKEQTRQMWLMWEKAQAQADQKIKLLLCDEHLKKCESPTGVFNSQYPDEEPCLICLAKEAKAQAVPDLSELQERIAGHQYYHDEHGHMIVDMDDVVKEISGFDSWKAQAVPEGFALVSQKDLLELTIAINAVDLATHTESKTNEVREMWQQVAIKLMALGTTQESAND